MTESNIKMQELCERMEQLNINYNDFKNYMKNNDQYTSLSRVDSWGDYSIEQDIIEEENEIILLLNKINNKKKIFIIEFLKCKNLKNKDKLISYWKTLKINDALNNDNDNKDVHENDDNDNKDIQDNDNKDVQDIHMLPTNSVWGGNKIESPVFKLQLKKNNYKKVEYKKTLQKKLNTKINRIDVMNLKDFKECIKNKLRGCIHGWNCNRTTCKFYHIHPDAHCEHTYKGTLCSHIKKCGKIHIQRCTNEIPHYNIDNIFILPTECYLKNECCSFLHRSNLSDKESQQNFIETINDYRQLRSSKLGDIQDDEDDSIKYI